MLLAGDIGGTKTTLATYEENGDPHSPRDKETYPSSHFASLEEVVEKFLRDTGRKVDRASFGVAGPVVNGEARITNLPWHLSEQHLAQNLGLTQVSLLNDLKAIATGVPQLRPDELHTLNRGEAVRGGTIGIIAPGTGLGEAYLTWDGSKYYPHSSEGGHTDFAPVDALQNGLLRYLQERFGHVSYERVCSGMGIPNIYSYLRDSHFAPEPDWLKQDLANAPDPTPIIISVAVEDRARCTLCTATLDTFVAILGAESGNLALKVLATGGIYLGGGIPPRIIPALKGDDFLFAFQHKGRFDSLLRDIPIHVILNPSIALMGAACHVTSQT